MNDPPALNSGGATPHPHPTGPGEKGESSKRGGRAPASCQVGSVDLASHPAGQLAGGVGPRHTRATGTLRALPFGQPPFLAFLAMALSLAGLFDLPPSLPRLRCPILATPVPADQARHPAAPQSHHHDQDAPDPLPECRARAAAGFEGVPA
jgi:hypothetical protein